ncbi:Glyoxylase, beta-lactamase superfamily II [Halorientalis persicus]|uniref:Glyoxylase, beta-lactamase superfamily II n=1 Tax=Halorientalis persicus TaxID=1367881 RepID=A0A1H8Q391_9EURY|nr:MBL fold metallo-hydrolase [Halorientalis persicus]SEO48670.1 Glyoxylase, beta-lactamase superfamily II [Halorientalis persicus]
MKFERQKVPQPVYGTVNIYRIGDTLIDTGHVTEDSRMAMADALDSGGLADVERVVLTHPHIDHVGGSQTLPELAALPHVVFEGVPSIITDFRRYLKRVHEEIQERSIGLAADRSAIDESYFPIDDYAEDDIQIGRVVGDGDTVRLGEYSCEVIHTPGHSRQHMALWHADSKTMFSADLVSTNGHFMYGPLYGDVGSYIDSLQRLRTYDANYLVPGHGPVISDPTKRIEEALGKTRRAMSGIKTAVETTNDRIAAGQLAREVFEATEETIGFLTLVVCEYLEYLEDENEVVISYAEDGIFAASS